MIRDGHTTFIEESRLPVNAAIITLCAANDGVLGGLKIFIPFGNFVVYSGSPVVIDLLANRDLGQGYPLIARMDITTDFAGDADNLLQLAAAVSSSSTFASDVTVIAKGTEFSTAGLTTNLYDEVVIPKLNASIVAGKRYFAMGLEVYVPATDWSAGAMTVKLGLNSDVFPTTPSVGYSII